MVSAGSSGAQGAEEVRILQEWVGGRVYVVQEGNEEDAHVIPDDFGGDEGYNWFDYDLRARETRIQRERDGDQVKKGTRGRRGSKVYNAIYSQQQACC